MTLEINNLSEIDSDRVATNIAMLSQFMQERHPDVELTRGVFYDLVLYFNGLLNAAVQQNIEQILQNRSLLQITQNPELADDTLVDHVLSNFNLSRDAGTPASGVITLVLLSPITTLISVEDTFSANGVDFLPVADFVLVPPPADGGVVVLAENERRIIAVGDGTYIANINVRATAVGQAGNLRRGTAVTPNNGINNLSDAYAANDFISGKDPSTNEEYLAKLSTGLAAKTIGGRKSYEALIKSQPIFENTLHYSILGCGDVEQQRDQHSLFPVSGGGKVDIYAHTNIFAQELDHVIDALYIGQTTNGSLWQFTLDENAAPGFYEVRRIARPNDIGASGYKIVNDVRGINLSTSTYAPDIRYVYEGAYSRYQTSVIQFEDTDSPTSGLIVNQSRAKYVVTTAGMPLIGELSDFLTAKDRRPRAADILVKAPVPCFTKISFQIHTEINDPVSDATIAEIKKAIVAAISRVGFSGQLHASVVTTAAHKYLTGRQAVNDLDMFGRIRRPDGSTTYVRSGVLLMIPNEADKLVTGRTTAFVVGEDDISISSVTAGFSD
jgi:hypothetical protein